MTLLSTLDKTKVYNRSLAKMLSIKMVFFRFQIRHKNQINAAFEIEKK